MEIVMLLDNPLKSDARVEKEAIILKENGHSISIYAVFDQNLPIFEEKPYGKIHRIISKSIDHPFSKEYAKFKTDFIQQISILDFQILHCHDYKMLILGAEIKKEKKNIKLVYDSHEFLYGWPIYKELKGLVNTLKGFIVWKWFVKRERLSIIEADAVITVSHSIADEFKEIFKLKNTPTVIRNIPETVPLLTEKYFHNKFSLPPNAKIIIHSGNLYHSESRIQMMIDTIETIKDVYLIFIGNSKKILELKNNNSNSKILFHDYIERLELYKIISSADFGIVHTWQPKWKSHWFSLPNRIMEYTTAGIPIISTKQPEFIKIGKEFNHLTFYHGNKKEELDHAIKEGISNFIKLKRNALKAREKLSWKEEALKLVQLYKYL